MVEIEDLPRGPPLGFPNCARCPYQLTGPPAFCLCCASRSFEAVPEEVCPVCSQVLEGGDCPNWLCRDPRRRIARISAIAYSSGQLRRRILSYKYRGVSGWSVIFGRLLLAWLERNAVEDPPGLIVAHPTYVASGPARDGHTERVLAAAAKEDVRGCWPIDVADPPAIVKTGPTERSASNSARSKRANAAALRRCLALPDVSRVAGRRVLIYDDICTTGSQLDAVARCLIEEGGATTVRAVVLARAPWRPR